MRPYFLTELVTKVKPNINPVEVHPQLSSNAHPLDGWCAGGHWFTVTDSIVDTPQQQQRSY
jgi:hypothetical protein